MRNVKQQKNLPRLYRALPAAKMKNVIEAAVHKTKT